MYKTPRFFAFIDTMSKTLNLNEGKTRKRALSESRTFNSKQVYFSEFLSQLELGLGIGKKDVDYIINILLKMENVLSDLANTPIYSNANKRNVEKYFFSNFAIVFSTMLIKKVALIIGNPVLLHLNDILQSSDVNNLDRDFVTSYVKEKLINEFKTTLVNKDDQAELSIFVSKIDCRSFPKEKSIRKFASNLNLGQSECENDEIISFLLASKIAFNLAKDHENFYSEECVENCEDVVNFLNCYIFNDSMNHTNFSYRSDKYYLSCKSKLLLFLGQKDPVKFLKEHNTIELWKHDNHVFMSYSIREKLYHYTNKFFISYEEVERYNEYLPIISNRQSGEDGVYISVFMIAAAIKLKKKLPQNYLQPYASLLCDSLVVEDINFPIIYSPFGFVDVSKFNVYEINVAYAIRSFNEIVKNGRVKSYFCNPLNQLDTLISKVMSNKIISARDKKIKPIKGFNVTIFDALVDVEFYLLAFGLQKETSRDDLGRVHVKTSIAGNWINRFLQLDEVDRRTILQSVSKEEYDLLMSK